MHPHMPSPATTIACLALFVALGGTAMAASRHVITSTSQIKASVLHAIVAPGPDVLIHGSVVNVGPGKHGALTAQCPGGDHLVTGGYSAELAPGALVTSDGPSGTTGWMVLIDNEKGTAVSPGLAHALCAPGLIPVVGKGFTLLGVQP